MKPSTRVGVPAEQPTPTALKYLLVATVFYIPNQRMFPDFSLTGLNITNLLFLVLLVLILRRRDVAPPSPPLKKQFIAYFLVLVWGFLIGQLYDGSKMFADLQVLKNAVLYMLLYFLAYYGACDRKTMRLLFYVMLFTVFFDTYLGLRQVLDYGMGYNETRRVAAPFSWNSTDANRSSAYYTLYLVPMAVTALYLPRRMLRWFAFACVGFVIFVNFFTYSRQSYGIIVVLLLLLAVRRSPVLVLVLAIALVNYHLWLPDSVVQRIDMTVKTKDVVPGEAEPLNKELDTSTESRFIIWGGAAQLFIRNPWGIGLDNFHRRIGEYAPDYAGYDAHDYFVLTTTENGFVAPIALVALLLGLFRLGRRVEKESREPESRLYGLSLWLGTLAVAMINLYGSRFVDGNLMSNFWILAGMTARYLQIVQESPDAVLKAPRTRPRSPLAGARTPTA
jgi:hypothetical protein